MEAVEKPSTLPTLLRKGFIKPNKKLKLSKSEIKTIENTKGIDYVINFISDRIPSGIGSAPRKKAKSRGDKVIVLKSETGSGKSTVLPPALYKAFQERTRKNIAVTQPRILTTIDISEGLPEHNSFLKMDDNLGYLTGDYKRPPLNKGIVFMQIGVLAGQLKVLTDMEIMNKYSFILIDEVHDRDLTVDTTLYFIKKLLTNNYDNAECPMLILMSATFDENVFMDYFGCPTENYIQVIGSTFPIEPYFLKYDSPNYIKYAIEKAEELHVSNFSDIDENKDDRDIIIFVSGASPAKEILESLHLYNSKLLSIGQSKNAAQNNFGKKTNGDKSVDKSVDKTVDKKKDEKTAGKQYFIAPIDLNSATFYASGSEYQNMFSDINNILIPIYKINDKNKIDDKSIIKWVSPSRRTIVATPVAETGVTIETLKYCIDTGLYTAVNFNPDFAIKSIITKDVTRGMAIQRRGRVGRKHPGKWYPCFTEKTFNSLAIDRFATILTDDITTELLGIFIKETDSAIVENLSSDRSPSFIKNNGLFLTNYPTNQNYYQLTNLKELNISAIDFVESPSANSLIYSVEKLYGLGFIDSSYKPTIMGMFANQIPKISMECRRMILAGYSHGANIIDLITMVSFIEVERKEIMNSYKYKPINIFPKKLSEKEYEFFYKIVIGDEFVEYLFIWEMYCEMLDKMMKDTKAKADKGKPYIFDVSKIADWCLENKLKYEGITKVATMRDNIIESLIAMGLNPYWNGIGIDKGSYSLLKMFRENLDECVGEVKKIKKCILDGFRFNLLVWDNSAKLYILHHRNTPVQVRAPVLSRMGDDAVQTNANFIISSNILLRSCMSNKEMYQFEHSGSISILDAYLDIDLGFLNH